MVTASNENQGREAVRKLDRTFRLDFFKLLKKYMKAFHYADHTAYEKGDAEVFKAALRREDCIEAMITAVLEWQLGDEEV